jgi:hypothetical protein
MNDAKYIGLDVHEAQTKQVQRVELLKLAHHAPSYSFNETGSESFFEEFLFKREINSLPAAGTPTLPSRTISFAVRLRPYSFLLALPSERSVEPSSATPANKPRVRE